MFVSRILLEFEHRGGYRTYGQAGAYHPPRRIPMACAPPAMRLYPGPLATPPNHCTGLVSPVSLNGRYFVHNRPRSPDVDFPVSAVLKTRLRFHRNINSWWLSFVRKATQLS
jgi:hypothetical protein